jgi:hypothetical protein
LEEQALADISVYTDPGAYVEGKIAQGAITLAQVPLAVTLIGVAAKNRLITNEAVIRGRISQTLTVAVSAPHNATLSIASDQKVDTTVVLRDNVALPKSGWSYQSATSIRIDPAYYKSGAIYTAFYIAPSVESDPLSYTSGIQAVRRVGSFPSVTSFLPSTDYVLSSNEIDFSGLLVASLEGVPVGPFDLSVNANLKFSLDGLADITVAITGAVQTAVTAAEVVADINAALAGNINYGVAYNAAASISSGKVKLSGIVKGETGSVALKQAAATSAHLEVFGVATVALPVTNLGTGKKPVLGSTYYVTYEVTRPSTDYNTPFEFFTLDAATTILGSQDADNPLAVYAGICFENGANSVFCVIVKDSDDDSVYSDTDFITAIAATETKRGMTEILPISTSLAVQVAAYNSVINMSSLLEQKPRRLWVGLARGAAVGDEDTAGTLIYMAARTLQVPGDSPGRGRFIVTAPCECEKIITLFDGSQVSLELDGTALAAACAAKQTSFTSAATSLLLKTITGFSVVSEYGDNERKRLASKGVSVVTLDAGRLVLTDPVTTEVSGGGLQEFSEISVMVQKDKVRTLVEQRVKSELVGIVPEDLADFISDLKEIVAITLRALIETGDVGKFTNANGTPRDIDLSKDIQAFQSSTNKTSYFFRFYFNGRYPAKRFFGEFSVDNPFFAPSGGAATS